MKVRRPQIDFTEALPHWSRHREFAQAFNAASTTLPHLEPYLNRVVRQARDALPPSARELIEDSRLFMQQEANHYKLHQLYNETLYRAGYEGLKEYEAGLHADFDRFLSSKSLRFNIAYAEGFESMGIVYARFFFERIDDLLNGADPSVTLLWKWHLAEEFEHRSVCHDLYKTLFGGYWYRVYGLMYAFFHLGAYGRRTTQFLLAVDRAGMTPEEQKRSRQRDLRYQLRLSAYAIPRVLAALSPFYNPRKRREPRGVAELLASIV